MGLVQELFSVALVLALLGAVAGLWPGRLERVAYALAGLASLALIWGVVTVLCGGGTVSLVSADWLPLARFHLEVDSLSAFFLLAAATVFLAASVYSLAGDGRRSPASLFNLFLLAVAGVLVAANILVFMLFWEVMTVVSYILVNTRHDRPGVARAGLIMLVMSQLGSALMLVAFLLLYAFGGSFDFATLHLVAAQAGSPLASAAVRDLVFLLVLVGFGVKAGMVPFHVWLPLAHPVAPANISALLSGVVINLGFYGAARVILGILGGGPVWWGVVVTGLGVLSAIFGMLYAVIDEDLKRVLAFSSIENMGLVFMGLGLSMVFSAYGLKAFAALALLVALFHALNHASYKGLLFLGAGAVERATGEHLLDAMGGLLKRMPLTGLFFLIGSLSIAAIPPSNGFVSEWLLFQTALQSFRLPGTVGIKILIAVAAAALALTAGLALTCFVRVFGIAFLGLPRTREARQASESPRAMLWGMGILAMFCVALGLLATAVIPLLDRVNQLIYGVSLLNQVVPPVSLRPGDFADLIRLGGGLLGAPSGINGWVIQPAAGFSSMSTLYIAVFVLLLLLVPVGITLLAGRRRTVPGKVWDGGRPEFLPNMQYTAVAYSNPIRMLFGRFFQLYGELEPKKGLLVYQSGVASLVEDYFYRPLTGATRRLAEKIAMLQSGSINLYVCYIFILLVVVLVASHYF